MLSIILSALPLYGLAALYLAYWLDPSLHLYITVDQLAQFLVIEGMVLFFCIFITGLIASGDAKTTFRNLSVLFFVIFLFSFGFDWEDRKLFWLLIAIHSLGMIDSTAIDRSRIYIALFGSLASLFLTGFLVYNIEIAKFADKYPPGIHPGTWIPSLSGQATLAWGTLHYSICATLHMLTYLIKYPENWGENKNTSTP